MDYFILQAQLTARILLELSPQMDLEENHLVLTMDF
jgi:hypothetical protein